MTDAKGEIYNSRSGRTETLTAEYKPESRTLYLQLGSEQRTLELSHGDDLNPDRLGARYLFRHMQHDLFRARETVKAVLEAALKEYGIRVY